jgi:hypothetical protein
VLSGGQQQRVALARAVVRNPSLLLFDEPLSNVAQEQRQEYLQLLIALKQKLPQSTFIYVTHNPREAMAFGKKLLIMHNGKVLQYGAKERVWQNPYHAEVLRTLCGQTKELVGNIQNGQFVGEGVTVPVSGVQDCERATLIYNPYHNQTPCVFDENGKLLQTDREHEMCLLSGTYDGDILAVGGKRYRMGEEFAKRFVGTAGEVKVGFPAIKLRTFPLFGDIALTAQQSGNQFTVQGEKFALYGVNDFNGNLYISPADVVLYGKNGRLTAHYCVYHTKQNGIAQRGTIQLPCGKIAYGGNKQGAVEVCLDGAHAVPVLKGGIRATCLLEEVLGDCKLVYCALKGWNNYVTFYAPIHETFLDKKKLRLLIDDKTITVTDAR